MNIRLLVCTLSVACAAVVARARAEPQPGDVFREFTYANRFHEVYPVSKREEVVRLSRNAMAERPLDITDLSGATRAEMVVEYWGGHVGTSEQAFRINGNNWLNIAQPEGTPTAPQCYYRTLLKATTEIPLDQLRSGLNTFQFKAGPQICHPFDWGFYWVYAFTVRVYYGPSKKRPAGSITSPSDGGEIRDMPRLVASAASAETTISRVEFIGKYEDYNWEGDGRYRQWHYQLERGHLRRHIGTAVLPPYAVTWDTQWVPDQSEPVEIAARIVDSHGVIYMTPSVRLTLRRKGRSVKMYKASDVPEKFGVRVGARRTCPIQIGDSLRSIRDARLVLSTWSAAHADEIGLNDRKLVDRVGPVHNYSFDAIPAPAGLLKTGENIFYIYSTTNEHAAEVNWPGPALLVEFAQAPKPAAR